MKRFIGITAIVLISIIPLLYLAVIWSHVPEIVPVHFDISNKPNGYGTRASLWIMSGIQTIVAIGTFVLTDIYFNKLKGGPYPPPKILPVLGILVSVVVTAFNFFMVLDCVGFIGLK